MKISEKANGILFDRKVRLVPVPRQGAMIEDPKHVGFFRYDGTKVSFVLPKSASRRTLYPLLNSEEQEFFEEVLDLDLNIHKKEDNFWATFSVPIEKTDLLMSTGIVFDLSEPMDNLKWRLLKIQNEIAPSWEQRYDKGSYMFAFVDMDHEEAQKVTRGVKKETAYKHLSKISNSAVKMYDFLSIYALQNPKAKMPAPDASRDALYAQCDELITNDLNGFLAVVDDPERDIKLLIHRAIGCGAIDHKINSKDYYTPEGKFLGNNLDQVVKNLRTSEYQEDMIKIKAVVSATTGDK